jgi:hypothetical protein
MVALVVSVGVLAPGRARASTPDPVPTLDTTKGQPWLENASREDQEAAHALFLSANADLKKSFVQQAAEKYSQALERWKHPAIHYNLALAQMKLGQLLEVHQNLEAAIRYGPAPLDPQKFERAREYKTLVEGQLARVEILCDTSEVSITLDGQPLCTAPGRSERLVRQGTHSLTAEKEGYLPTTRSLVLQGGQKVTLSPRLHISGRRLLPAWMPWAMMGAGAAVAAGGGLLHARARDNYRAFDAGILACNGCVPDSSLRDTRTRGDLQQRVAVSTYALGGAALVAGAVLIYFNQPTPHRIDLEERETHVSVEPLLGGGTNGILTTLRF